MYKTRTIIGILIAFALAVAAYGYWMSSPTGALTEPMTHRLVTDFAARDAVGHINLSALKSGGNFKALVNPASLLPHTAEFPPAQLQKVYAFANNCKVSELRGVAAPSLQKTVAWHRFLCGIDPKLSDQFFETGPLFHPSGSSFVFLAVLSNVAVFHDKTWIDRHRDFLHLREYAELAASHLVPEDDSTRILARLSLGAFSEIARENLVILDDRFMLVLQPESGRDFLHREYDAFDAENWRRYLAATPYSVGPARAGSHCALLASDLCWNIDAGKLQRYRLCMAVGGLTASGLLLVLTVWTLIAWTRQKRRLAQEKEHVFQALTHELRTPITNLKLLVESLRRGYDALPSEAQKSFLILGDEVQKLERLVRASVAYLDPGRSGAKGSETDNVPIKLSDLVRTIVDPYGDRVKTVGLESDLTIRGDAYWLGICIKNLISNALEHGAPPVVVEITGDRASARCSVTDGGKLPARNLKELLKPFGKGSNSRGLGLGLTITAKAVRKMGGSLSLRAEPSTFTLNLRRST